MQKYEFRVNFNGTLVAIWRRYDKVVFVVVYVGSAVEDNYVGDVNVVYASGDEDCVFLSM